MGGPSRLQDIVRAFRSAPPEMRIQALLDFSRRVPPLPEELAEARDQMEPVPECQTPFFLATRVDADGVVTMHFDTPEESPTVRGYAGILSEGLNGSSVEEILSVPDDFYMEMGLEEVVTPLRLRGMGAILARLKRQVRDQAA